MELSRLYVGSFESNWGIIPVVKHCKSLILSPEYERAPSPDVYTNLIKIVIKPSKT